MDDPRSQELLDFFKALADANRLKIIGLLALKDYSAEEMATILDVRPSTVSHHLGFLNHLGLVSARAESYYNIYTLELDHLQEMTRRVLSRENLQEIAADIDLDAYDRKVVKNFMGKDGRLKALPSQRKKLEAILNYVVQAFEYDTIYTEKEVNDLLRQFHDDTARLRRELFEQGRLGRDRQGKEYWLIKTDL